MNTIEQLETALSGRYEVGREIGAGGMATVYRARDLRHDRPVALKVLRPELSAILGAERFLKEIRTTANLQHPHILPLHDSGEADGFLFYVMPFVEGETLRGRLERERQLPLDDALRLTREVLSALDYAHRHGVIHRDVKPENVLLHDGQALVADFGIALAVSAVGGGTRLTETGMSLGTPHYMSPEQAMGEKSVDGRADVYAAGAMLYEMLTGEPPFTGATVQAIVAKVMTERPTAPSTVRDTVPAHVEAAVLRALAKLPADRFASAAQFADALDRPAGTHAATTASVLRPGAEARWRRAAWAAGVVAAASLGAAAVGWTRRDASVPVERFELASLQIRPVSLAAAMTYTGPTLALSADGARIAYVRRDSAGVGRVWIRDLGDLTPRPVAGTEGASCVTIAPDGRGVAFVVGTALAAVPVDGGSPVVLVRQDASMPQWGEDGNIYFSPSPSSGHVTVARVPAGGGSVQTIARADAELYDPAPLPDGRGMLVSTHRFGRGEQNMISVVSLPDGRLRELTPGVRPVYAAPGYLVYLLGRRLMAAPFDARTLALTGPAVPVVDSGPAGPGLVAQHAVSASGSLIYMTALRLSGLRELVWVGRDGAVQVVDSAQRGRPAFPALSPDGSRVAYARGGSLWVKQLDRGPELQVTSDPGGPNYPAWTPDGRTLSYFMTDPAGYHLRRKPADGSAQATPLLPQLPTIVESTWSRHGGWLVFRTAADREGGGDIWAIRPGVDSVPTPIVNGRATEAEPALSPDGRFLAYASNESGRYEIYVVPFPDAASARWVVSTGGGLEPAWSPHGDELFYRDVAGDLVSVQVRTTPTFAPGASTALFNASAYDQYEGHRQYDVAADGRRFLMLRPVAGGDQPSVVLVKGWLETVRARVAERAR